MDPSAWLAFFAASWAISLSPDAGALAAVQASAAAVPARSMVLRAD